MIVKIVCASKDSFSKLYTHDNDEFIIGCDGGCEILNKLDISYHLALGDFDSFDINKVNSNINIMKFKSEKDESDLELAIDYALKLNPEKIEVYNATGKRLDHLYAGLNLLKSLNNDKIVIIDEFNKIYLSNSNSFRKSKFKYISFFSIMPNTTISLKGFKYELDNYDLSINDSLCLSNEIIEVGVLTTNNKVLVIESL